MRNIIIFSAKVAKDLIQNKFTLVNINPDNDCKIKTVFYFEDTKKLREYLKDEHNIVIPK